jgi:hypothetical protein
VSNLTLTQRSKFSGLWRVKLKPVVGKPDVLVEGHVGLYFAFECALVINSRSLPGRFLALTKHRRRVKFAARSFLINFLLLCWRHMMGPQIDCKLQQLRAGFSIAKCKSFLLASVKFEKKASDT